MNSHGVKVEKDLRKPIMSSLHAGWAFGGMAGAAFSAACSALGLDPRVTVAITSVLLFALLYASASRIGHGSAAAGEETPGFTLPSRGVVLLAVLCLLVMVTEGAMADWGGLYLRQDLGASAALAALAYSFFTAGMTVGRVAGDWINHRIGAVALLRWGALLTGIPLGAMLLIGQPAVALVGLFLVGLGVANGVPLMFSAAGRQPDTPPGPGIAAVSSMGSLGFLAGPPVIGVLADAVSLPWALSLLILGAVVVFALARRATGAHAGRAAARGRGAGRPGGGAMTFAAVISDFDGVLADSSASIRRAWARWGERHGIDGAAIQAANHGRPSREVVAEHVAPELVAAESAWVLEAEVADTDGVVAYPGRGRGARAAGRGDRHLVRGAARPRPARGRRAGAARGARDVRRGRARQARARRLPARRRAARRRSGGVPRAGGRAERRRRRPRGRHDRVGGHDDARGGGARRRRPDRRRPARAAGPPQPSSSVSRYSP